MRPRLNFHVDLGSKPNGIPKYKDHLVDELIYISRFHYPTSIFHNYIGQKYKGTKCDFDKTDKELEAYVKENVSVFYTYKVNHQFDDDKEEAVNTYSLIPRVMKSDCTIVLDKEEFVETVKPIHTMNKHDITNHHISLINTPVLSDNDVKHITVVKSEYRCELPVVQTIPAVIPKKLNKLGKPFVEKVTDLKIASLSWQLAALFSTDSKGCVVDVGVQNDKDTLYGGVLYQKTDIVLIALQNMLNQTAEKISTKNLSGLKFATFLYWMFESYPGGAGMFLNGLAVCVTNPSRVAVIPKRDNQGKLSPYYKTANIEEVKYVAKNTVPIEITFAGKLIYRYENKYLCDQLNTAYAYVNQSRLVRKKDDSAFSGLTDGYTLGLPVDRQTMTAVNMSTIANAIMTGYNTIYIRASTKDELHFLSHSLRTRYPKVPIYNVGQACHSDLFTMAVPLGELDNSQLGMFAQVKEHKEPRLLIDMTIGISIPVTDEKSLKLRINERRTYIETLPSVRNKQFNVMKSFMPYDDVDAHFEGDDIAFMKGLSPHNCQSWFLVGGIEFCDMPYLRPYLDYDEFCRDVAMDSVLANVVRNYAHVDLSYGVYLRLFNRPRVPHSKIVPPVGMYNKIMLDIIQHAEIDTVTMDPKEYEDLINQYRSNIGLEILVKHEDDPPQPPPQKGGARPPPRRQNDNAPQQQPKTENDALDEFERARQQMGDLGDYKPPGTELGKGKRGETSTGGKNKKGKKGKRGNN